MQGFITLQRKLVDWEWWMDHNTTRLFIYLLLTVNWEDKKWRGEIIPRGSIITSYSNLSKSTGISTQSIRTSLERLKSTHELTIKTTNKYTHISINKYNEYQESTSKLTNNQQTTNKQLTTTKQYNNNNNITKREGRNLTEQDFQEIAEKYNIPLSFVLSEWDSLQNWCAAKGKVYKDYKAALCNWVKKDAIERIDHANTNNLKRGIDASNL